LKTKALVRLQEEVASLHVSEAILNLVVRFLTHARSQGEILSPRAGRDLVRVSQAIAYLKDQKHVLPEDVKHVLKAVIDHRVKDANALLASFSFQA
jgi:MoxR-like ATPase